MIDVNKNKNSFFLIKDTIDNYQKHNFSPNELINSFCLLNKTIPPIFNEKEEINKKIDLNRMKNYDKSNNEKVKLIHENNNSPFYSERKKFIENSFFNNILMNQKQFENIHNDEEFKLPQNEDKANSSFYYHIQIMNNLEEKGEIKNAEEKVKKSLEKLEKDEKEKYSLISDEFECNIKDKVNFYYRRVKPNGNSFFISFMYQYIKSLISINKESIIAEIFYIMDKELNFQNNANKPKSNSNSDNDKENNFGLGEIYISNSSKNNDLMNLIFTFALFSMLYKNMADKKTNEAEKILEYGFTYEESFANFFCFFMRIQLKNFIKNNKDIFTYEKYCKQMNLIEERYYNNGIFLCDEYINNNVIVNQKEPSFFIISLVPYVFNVSMNLYINEKYFSFDKICFNLKEKYDANITILILYSSFSYHIIEPNSNLTNSGINNIDSANTLNLKNNYQNFNIEKYMINIKDEKNCDICKKSELILLKNISKIPVCLNCLRNTINEILIARYKKMVFQRFKYLEFYLRDISIISFNDSNNFLFLSPPEFYCLFKNSIYIYFINLIKNVCVSCFGHDNQMIEKKCGCINCLNCCCFKDGQKKKKIVIPIIDFEKNYIFKDAKIKCICGKQNDYVELASKIYDKYDENQKEDLKKSIDSRINNYIKKYCFICGIDLKIDSIGKSKVFKIRFDKREINEHYICENCNNKKVKISSIECIICQKNHENKENKENKKNRENRENRGIDENNNQTKRKSSIKNSKIKNSEKSNISSNNEEESKISNSNKKRESINSSKKNKDESCSACCIIY